MYAYATHLTGPLTSIGPTDPPPRAEAPRCGPDRATPWPQPPGAALTAATVARMANNLYMIWQLLLFSLVGVTVDDVLTTAQPRAFIASPIVVHKDHRVETQGAAPVPKDSHLTPPPLISADSVYQRGNSIIEHVFCFAY